MKHRKSKKQNFLFSILVCVLLISLSACSNSIQKQFLKKNAKLNATAGSFTVTLPELKLNSEAANEAYASIFSTQLETAKLEGKYSFSGHNQAFVIDAQLDLLNQGLPLYIVGNADVQYLSLDFVPPIYRTIAEFSGINEQDLEEQLSLSKFEGTYLDVGASLDTSNVAKKSKKQVKLEAKLRKELIKEFVNYLKQLDQSHFSETKTVISLKLTKQQLIDMLDLYDNIISKEKYAEIEPLIDKKQLKKMDLDKSYRQIALTISVSKKEKQRTLSLVLIPEEKQKSAFEKLELAVEQASKKQKLQIKLPAEKAVLTLAEVRKLLKPNSLLEPIS